MLKVSQMFDTSRVSKRLVLGIATAVSSLFGQVVVQLLGIFRRYRLNMTKIESRPSKRTAWEYFFFVDCDGHFDDKRVANAISDLQQHCTFVKVLGSFPRAAEGA